MRLPWPFSFSVGAPLGGQAAAQENAAPGVVEDLPVLIGDCAAQQRPGGCTVTLELTTSLRNLLGPHHLDEGESYGVNTRSFDKEPNAIDNPAPPWNDGYCFVKLGLRDIVLA